MATPRILTEVDMARLLSVEVDVVRSSFRNGDLPGFEVGPGHLRCTEPAFVEWVERRSREPVADATPVDPVAAAEAEFAEAGPERDRFTPLSALGGPLARLVGETLSTPDRRRSRPFRVDAVDLDRRGVRLTPQGTLRPVWIRADALDRCLFFLGTRVPHGEAIPIRASQNKPGQLARFTRRGNGGQRCLHYLLPMLQAVGLVEIDGESRPNTVRSNPAPAHHADEGAEHAEAR